MYVHIPHSCTFVERTQETYLGISLKWRNICHPWKPWFISSDSLDSIKTLLLIICTEHLPNVLLVAATKNYTKTLILHHICSDTCISWLILCSLKNIIKCFIFHLRVKVVCFPKSCIYFIVFPLDAYRDNRSIESLEHYPFHSSNFRYWWYSFDHLLGFDDVDNNSKAIMILL